VLLQQRPSPGIWGGLWAPPPDFASVEAAEQFCSARLQHAQLEPAPLPLLKHGFTPVVDPEFTGSLSRAGWRRVSSIFGLVAFSAQGSVSKSSIASLTTRRSIRWCAFVPLRLNLIPESLARRASWNQSLRQIRIHGSPVSCPIDRCSVIESRSLSD